ncbi:MFS transporter [Thermopolyspora sp. NPDC052614]|uniref:MFS transporter n=1 Tax=Thermopolyspora sp. NPDC052614 TaxID=3155682 RepID=UPI003419AE11
MTALDLADFAPPPARAARRSRWIALPVLCLGQVIVGLDQTVLHIAVPSLTWKLGADPTEAQWAIDAYTLALAGLLLAGGRLGERLGRRPILVLGLTVFALASLAGSQATAVDQLIAARAAMGVGAALIMPSALSLLIDLFPDRRERARAVGIWSAGIGVGVAAGPAVGGWVLENFWWGSILLVNVPICLFALVVVPILVPASRNPDIGAVDPLGMLLGVLGLGAVVWAIIEAPPRGLTDPAVLAAAGTGVVALVALALRARRRTPPLVDIRVLHGPRFAAATIAIALTWFCLFGALFVIAQHLQTTLAMGPLEAGLRLLPLAGGLLAGVLLAAWLGGRDGEKTPAVVGLMLIAGAMGVLGSTTAMSGYGQLAVVLAVGGCGMAMAMKTTTEATLRAVPLAHANVAAAIGDAARQAGGAIGIAILGGVARVVYAANMAPAAALVEPARREAALANVSVTVRVAERMPESEASDLLAQSASAYAHAISVAAWIAAGAAMLAALLVAIWLPLQPRRTRARSRPSRTGQRLIHPQLQTLYLAALALRRSLDDGYLPPSHTLRHLARLTVRDADGGVWLIEPSTGRFLRQEVADPHTFEPAELPDPLQPDPAPAPAGVR